MTEKIKEDLEYIIKNKKIKTVFQPIISLRDGSVLGHEALSRITCDSEIKNPEMLFIAAGMYNRLWELELLCRTEALESAYIFMIPPYSKKLFLNVNPNIMHDETFKKGFTKNFLKQYQITPENVIFEITERNVITDVSGFTAAIDHYKSQDYQIAIDDAGAGHSGLNLISDVNPHYIKLDMKLIRCVDTDSVKYALVKGMVEFSKVSNISLIAEGIETFDELETLINLGVQYGQGYLIQKPDAEIREIDERIICVIQKCDRKKNEGHSNFISNICIKNLCTYTSVVSAGDMVFDVYEMFRHNPDCFGVCVVEDNIPLGIVTREKLTFKLSGQYGFSLYHKKAISELMDRNFLSVDYKTSITEVSSVAMSRPNNKLYDFIVVTENRKYIGTVTIKDLLQKTIEIEVTAAKHLNPLSGLPGNLIIEQMLMQCVSGVCNYSIAYFDIDNFKAYNDVYGFEKGDLIIKLLADIIRKNLPDEQFVGHIGGDDFVVILPEQVEENYFSGIVSEFEREVLSFYCEKDIANGYIITNNRRGEQEKFPLITLTSVLINNNQKNFYNVYELTKALAELKKKAKSMKLAPLA